MKKIEACMKIIIICIFLLPIVSPLAYSQQITTQKTIPIQTVFTSDTGDQRQTTYLSSSDADELRQLLISLDDALTRKDTREIQHYETILKSKGIIPATYQFHTSVPAVEPRYQKLRHLRLPVLGDNISNTLCYLHAAGSGTLFFTIGILLMIPTLILISIFGSEILNILIPLYVLIMVATHLIPFRVMLPIGSMILDEGNVSAIGISGSQHITVEDGSVQVNMIGFTGITINIASNNQTDGFLFVSGFSLSAFS